jgi:hypothetical protein
MNQGTTKLNVVQMAIWTVLHVQLPYTRHLQEFHDLKVHHRSLCISGLCRTVLSPCLFWQCSLQLRQVFDWDGIANYSYNQSAEKIPHGVPHTRQQQQLNITVWLIFFVDCSVGLQVSRCVLYAATAKYS